MNAFNWLMEQKNSREIQQEEQDTISEFLILWSFFEACALKTDANIKNIRSAVKTWQEESLLTDNIFKKECEYFRKRYLTSGEINRKFEHLCPLLGNVKEDRVRITLKELLPKSEILPNETTELVLLVIYRLRNNLVHGSKWAYEIQDQLESFTNANEALKIAITLQKTLTCSAAYSAERR